MQSTTIRLMMALHQTNGWNCRHLDYVLAFTQAPEDSDACLRTPSGFHVQNQDGEDVPDQHCLKLLKNCYETRDAEAIGSPSYKRV